MGSFIVDTLALIDTLLANYVGTLWGRIVDHYRDTAIALITLAVIFMGFRLIMGKVQEPVQHVAWKLVLSIGLFVILATNWEIYSFYIYDLTVNGTAEMMSTVMGGNTPFEELDIIVVHMFGAAAKIAEFSDIGMIFAWLLAALYMLAGIIMATIALFMIIVARLATSILLGIGPVFLICAIFNATRGMFDGWVKLLLQYALQAVIAVAVLAFSILIIKDFIIDAGLGRVDITIQLVGVQIILLLTSAALLSQVGRIAASIAGGYALSSYEVYQFISAGVANTAGAVKAGYNGSGRVAGAARSGVAGGFSALRKMQDSRVNRISPARGSNT